MSEPVWKHGDIKLILRDDHTWVSKVNEPPSEFLCRILKDREKHGAQWRGYSYGTAAVERRLRQQGAEL